MMQGAQSQQRCQVDPGLSLKPRSPSGKTQCPACHVDGADDQDRQHDQTQRDRQQKFKKRKFKKVETNIPRKKRIVGAKSSSHSAREGHDLPLVGQVNTHPNPDDQGKKAKRSPYPDLTGDLDRRAFLPVSKGFHAGLPR